ncbi:PTS system lactose-specific IIA component [Clostridium acetobutylicum]|uniref:PTS system lactose-specific enzyme IIA n=1 Tax=Clostridium acetobutylicum (strain ATCC 824 / DSM 792 / JCM 1419 / IAM 19013 / LMG 5710 / NBRC 13948 / NRRL B-527 / VKM B-1787 / 2291 / W) TaxID=272562 RepID=Q97EZ0_CLOAB|nr:MULTISPECIES: PTS lactose/cellobiose transporter subunit IIA [Clostridium]AAK80907.1 PTS system lactose-specific enzyme IIA [Clostridium acetobutylicum ATCC 824]ADZ22009.1 PTS system lactose-specific enzyme IIA [Clostridium acetobutylicum EA 2018]AEI34261.1 PTS system lactose-specific enzyme IIA [Clostridium acetobutylicum DSM 1731]AWV78681.1 PTS lactose/cellobiose transporter subunit IIA [Clostridium acetobutylicum]KHD37268.1 PTS system lactose-specific transporter subunit IIA [Clostridium
MNKEELELTTMEIVAYAGDARSKYLEALNAANGGDYDKAQQLVLEGNDLITEAHNVQTKMIQMEAQGKKIEVGFLVVHAQDHLMTVMLLRDLVKNLINLYKKVN